MKKEHLKIIPKNFALAAAITMAVTIFLISLLATQGLFQVISSLILDTYGSFGYKVTFLGSFLAAFYAFIDTFIIAYIFAWLYNKF